MDIPQKIKKPKLNKFISLEHSVEEIERKIQQNHY
jgi:hypothetical protein